MSPTEAFPIPEFLRNPIIDLGNVVENACGVTDRQKTHLLNLKGTTNGTWSEDAIESRTCTLAESTSK